MKKILTIILLFSLVAVHADNKSKIDRHALVTRNIPVVTRLDTLSSLSVGNGRFAFTADVTGLQSFPEHYKNGVCLGTQSEWGWHSFPNSEGYEFSEVLKPFDFGHHSSRELYACQFREKGRQRDASDYFRSNPHRLHLGIVGFDFQSLRRGITPSDIRDIHQTLDIWNGELNSHFSVDGQYYAVHTVCSPTRDMISCSVTYKPSFSGVTEPHAPVSLRLPYPTGGHVDNGCDWQKPGLHTSAVVAEGRHHAVIRHTLDNYTYYIIVRWQQDASLCPSAPHTYTLRPASDSLDFSVEFCQNLPATPCDEKDIRATSYSIVRSASSAHWHNFWTSGAAVDFSHCRDARARELERRVVLSQYLLAIQCAGSTPPQETGLTMNSWFGKFHLEMILWHQAWMPLWGHPEMLARTLGWYATVEPVARGIARRQGFDGIRWMKMTDPSGNEAPSNVGSFLIWQQPHLIYLAELVYRATGDTTFLRQYHPLVESTAAFMYSFANYDKKRRRYILRGNIPAQESLKASVTLNSPFELSQWHTTMSMAQQWNERLGLPRVKSWDRLIDRLSVLAFNSDSLYLAAESATDTYTDVKATSDHPALLGALGFFPDSCLINRSVMEKTLNWIAGNWNWPTSWGWDFPMTAMTATRLLQPEKAVDALLMDVQKNTYLPNGHNYQDKRLRLYLPGNGGLLSAVALMCAGWDGCTRRNPGFPDDGNWDVRWEGLQPLP